MMTKLDVLKKKWLKKPDVKTEYNILGDEFSTKEALQIKNERSEVASVKIAT